MCISSINKTKMYLRQLFLKTRHFSLRQVVENANIQSILNYHSYSCNYNIYEKLRFKSNKTILKVIRQCHQKINTKEQSEQTKEYNDDIVMENVEAVWYHKKIYNLPGYSNMLVGSPYEKNVSDEEAETLLKANWKIMSSQELLSNFETITSYIFTCWKNNKTVNYQSVLLDLEDRLPHLTDNEMEHILKQYQLLKIFNKKPEHRQFTEKLSNEILKRVYDYSLEQKFKMCDLLHMAQLSKVTQCFWKLMKMISNKVHQMSRQQLVHLCYLLTSNSHCPQHMYEIEYHLSKHLNDMDLNELSTIALCFFKKKYQPRDKEFLINIVQSALKNIDKIETHHASSIMKFCRSFRNKEELHNLEKLLHAFEERFDIFTTKTGIHIAHAAANNTIFIPTLMDKIIDRFMKNPEELRLKDWERLSFALNTFNYDPRHPIFSAINKRMRDILSTNNMETTKFTKALPIACMYMGQAGYYSPSTLEIIMNEKFYKPIYKSLVHNLNLEYLWLGQSIRIEVPNYKGELIDENIIFKLSKLLKKGIPSPQNGNISKHNNTVLNILSEYEKLFGKHAVTINHILPHYLKPDLIITLDKYNKSMPVEEMLPQNSNLKYIPEEFKTDIQWFAIIIGTQFSYLHNSNQVTGFVRSKMRQLERLGYIPLMITFDSWNSNLRSRSKFLESVLLDENNRNIFKNELFIEQ